MNVRGSSTAAGAVIEVDNCLYVSTGAMFNIQAR
jgi:hypothetical protein